jgi:1-acyl-sn-glycerol-3-phosphate acyltransferase
MNRRAAGSRFLLDLIRTLILWAYFTLGFLTAFLPFYLAAGLLAEDRRRAFQGLNHRFFNVFFRLLQWLIPGAAFDISPEVRAIRGAVIVCNHRSYLDPILLISLFQRQKTIVKALFFRLQIFSWVLRSAGYLPSSAGSQAAVGMLDGLENLEAFLAEGGNLFVFPEGTRGLGRGVGKLAKGAFRIARRCSAPLEVICIDGSDRLFAPGRFLFNTCRPSVISVRRLGRLAAGAEPSRISDQVQWVRSLFEA